MKGKIFLDDLDILAFKQMLKEIDVQEKNIIIVPDKFTLNAEMMFFEEKNLTVNFNTRIFSISKFVGEILKENITDKKIINKNQSVMIISSIITENLQQLKYFKTIKDINKFSEDVFNSINQLLSSNFKQENEINDINLKNKFQDIKFILNEYVKRREKNIIDGNYRYDLFLKEIKNSEIIKNSHFYFGVFNTLTSQVKNIIAEIYKYANFVGFSCSKIENRVNNNEIYEFYKSLDKNILIQKTSSLIGYNKFILDNFFTTKEQKYNLKNDEIKIFEAKTIDDEISNLILEIKKDVALNNLRFKDICICCSDLNLYYEKLVKNFDKNQISYFCDKNLTFNETSFARFINTLLKTINELKLADFINLLDSGYVKIDTKVKQNFKSFVFKYNINDLKNLLNFKACCEDKLYKDYCFVYENFILKIINFKNIQFSNVYYFFQELDVLLSEFYSFELLNEKIEFLKQNDLKTFKQYLQIEDKFNTIKQSIIDFYNDSFDFNKICYFLNLCFENTNISLASTSADSVFVADSLNSYIKNFKKIYIIGADSKKFPLVKNSTGLFSDRELEKIEREKISPKICEVNKLNYFKCFELLMSSSEKLCLSYSLSSSENGKNFPSIFIKSICKNFLVENRTFKILKIDNDLLNSLDFNEILNLIPYKFNNLDDIEREYYNSYGNLKIVIKNILDKKRVSEDFIPLESKIDTKYVKNKKFSPSKLENYFSCSYKYFLNDILKLKKIEQIKLDSRIIGIIIHKCAYYFALELKNKTDVTFDRQNQIIDFVLSDKTYEIIIKDKGNKELVNKLRKEILKLFAFIKEEQDISEFKISKVEFYINDVIDGINFEGFVDRIDETEDEFIVIDYKSGNTIINYKDILLSRKIQLIFYSKILEKILNKKCRGIFYLTIRDDFSTKTNKGINFNGIIINEGNSIKKIGLNEKYFNIEKKFIFSEKQFKRLSDYVFNNIKTAVNNIQNAEFKSEPYNTDNLCVCDYCEFNTICKNKIINDIDFDKNLLEEILND